MEKLFIAVILILIVIGFVNLLVAWRKPVRQHRRTVIERTYKAGYADGWQAYHEHLLKLQAPRKLSAEEMHDRREYLDGRRSVPPPSQSSS